MNNKQYKKKSEAGRFGEVTISFQNNHTPVINSNHREKVSAGIIAGEGAKLIFKKFFETHKEIKAYISKIKNENPNMGLEDLKTLTMGYIERRNFKNCLFSSMELELYYINKAVDSGKGMEGADGVFLTFLETSLNNKRFDLGPSRKSIFFHSLDVSALLDKEIPEFEHKGSFYLNLGATDLENLSDLHITIFYKPS